MLKISLLHNTVFSWWRSAGRVLPWREKYAVPVSLNREKVFADYFASSLRRDPYRVIVAEMMLQQTQVDRVVLKYQSWIHTWPSTGALSKASLAEVLIFWQGLGYNRRAKFLWQLAQQIEQKNGVWPTTEAELLKLPGIGKYTARAVMSFAFGMQVGVVDTNIKRVIGRTQGIEWKEKQVLPAINLKTDYFQAADQLLPKDQADPWNQAIMDLGAMICTAKSPKCTICPVNHLCQSNLQAQDQGWKQYSDWLKKTEQSRKVSEGRVKKKAIRFEETDRFFRGRIMDFLRVSSYKSAKLAKKMEAEFGLTEQERFQKILTALKSEGLVSIIEDTVQLG